MKKVGPAFFESISQEKVRSARGRSSIVPDELLRFIPLVLMILIFSFLAFRMFYLQVLNADYYYRLSDENRLRSTLIPAPRGILFDRKNRPLVSNSPSFMILDKDGKTVWLKKDDALERIAKGEKVLSSIQRNYLYKDVFAHVLGYVGQISADQVMLPQYSGYGVSDFIGKMGLEYQYETLLHGKNGKELYEVDAMGKQVRFLGKEEEVAGKNIVTTLDIDIQLVAKDAMEDIQKGAVVVTDPRDGAIRALYSKPSYDPNVFTHTDDYKSTGPYQKVEQILLDGENQPLLDRAISGVYPPGSTYKLITSIAALQNGAITPDTRYEDTGVLTIGQYSFGTWNYRQYGKKEGALNVVSALKRSNDIFYYKTAEELGVTELSNWSRKLGLGDTLGIDLPGEAKGTVPDPAWKKEVIGEQWYLGDIFNMSIGQGYVLATPLQVNMFTVPFANDRVLYRPHLIANHEEILQKDVMKKEYQEVVRQGMKESCEPGGVAFPFFDFKVKNDKLPIDQKNYFESASGSAKMTRVVVGCKTGTSETPGDESDPHAWISVFAPYHDPEVVVTVLAENSGEGSSVAGPIAKRILEKYFEKWE